MNREQVKKLMPILQAFAEGKTIEIRTDPKNITNPSMPNDWVVMDELECWTNTEYRIKPTSTYRPFANAEECWQEMLKHQPFGWVKKKSNSRAYNILSVLLKEDNLYIRSNYVTLGKAFENYTFADGAPFGIKESED